MWKLFYGKSRNTDDIQEKITNRGRDGYGGKRWKINLDLDVGNNPYLILEEHTLEFKKQLHNIGYDDFTNFGLSLYDDDGYFKEILIYEKEMKYNPFLLEIISRNKTYKPIVANSYIVSPMGTHEKVSNLIYSYINYHESKIRDKKKDDKYDKLYNEILDRAYDE